MKPSSKLMTVVTMIAVATCFFGISDARHILQGNDSTVLDKLKCGKTFSILKAAVKEAGLMDALTDPNADITLFAPSNTAFVAALDELGMTAEELIASDKLADILKYHVKAGKTVSDDIPEGKTNVPSLLGPDIVIDNGTDSIKVNDAMVQYADLEASNGVVHVIDRVLLPPSEEDAEEDFNGESRESEKVSEDEDEDQPILG